MGKNIEDAGERRNDNYHQGDGKQLLSMEGNKHARELLNKGTGAESVNFIEKYIKENGADAVDEYVARCLASPCRSGYLPGMMKGLEQIAQAMENNPAVREQIWQGLKQFDNLMADEGIEIRLGAKSADKDHKHIDSLSISMHAPGHPDGVEIKVSRHGNTFQQSATCYDWETKQDNYDDPSQIVKAFNKGDSSAQSMLREIKKALDEKGHMDVFSSSMDPDSALKQISIIAQYAGLHGFDGKKNHESVDNLVKACNDHLQKNQSQFRIDIDEHSIGITNERNGQRMSTGFKRPMPRYFD